MISNSSLDRRTRGLPPCFASGCPRESILTIALLAAPNEYGFRTVGPDCGEIQLMNELDLTYGFTPLPSFDFAACSRLTYDSVHALFASASWWCVYIRPDTVMHLEDRLVVHKIAFEASMEALQRFIARVLDGVVDYAELRRKRRRQDRLDDSRVSSATSRRP